MAQRTILGILRNRHVLAAGFGCGTALYGSQALADNDTARTLLSWGSSQFGQLGLGGEDGCAAGNPNPTASDYLARHDVLSVAAGGESWLAGELASCWWESWLSRFLAFYRMRARCEHHAF